MANMKTLDDFLTQAGVFYLATIEGDHPKCRPMGMHLLIGDTIYFGVGEFKACYKQMQENPKVEICATVGKEFIRFYGRAVFEKDYTLAEKALEAAPYLRAIYNEQTGNRLGMFHLEPATCEFRTMLDVKESFQV